MAEDFDNEGTWLVVCERCHEQTEMVGPLPTACPVCRKHEILVTRQANEL